jgi:hypothetical protein
MVQAHAFFFHEVAVPRGVVPESVHGSGTRRNDFALPGLPAKRFGPRRLGVSEAALLRWMDEQEEYAPQQTF